MFLGWFSSIYLKKESLYQNSIERVRDFRVPNMSVDCKSFDEVIPNYPNDFLYCDTPYYMEKKEEIYNTAYKIIDRYTNRDIAEMIMSI